LSGIEMGAPGRACGENGATAGTVIRRGNDDGITMVFQNTPGTEERVEMNTYFPHGEHSGR